MKKFSEGKAVAEKLLLQKSGCLSIPIRYRNGGVNLKGSGFVPVLDCPFPDNPEIALTPFPLAHFLS